MKRLLLVLAAAGIFAVSCQTDDTTNNVPNVEEGWSLTVSLPATPRTSFGDKVGDTYPVYWSAGDKIVINGELSDEVKIDTEDRSSATFALDTAPEYPLSITYPYCESTTADQPIVEFPAKQEYTEGSFASGSVPMCGYAENGTRAITMKHLGGVLRFPIKAIDAGVVLSKIVITSENNITGEFKVNCQNTTITAARNLGKVVIYTLPANFTLSTSTESVFYISLPAVNIGRCTIEFIEDSGEKMVATWTPSKPIAMGTVREFKTIAYGQKTSIELQALEADEAEFKVYHNTVYGYVKYSDGTPISNVAVSDGFQITKTNSNGYYELTGVTPQTWYIYCSMPNDVKIPINEFGRPDFYKKYPASSPQYDFTFEKLPNGPETDFYIIAMADTQPRDLEVVERFRVQAAPEIKSYTKSLGLPCYGVVLGDLVGSNFDMEPIRTELHADKLGMPVFTVMGNHDHIASSYANLLTDERNRNANIKKQRTYEECFGPVNFSYDRGNVHIVGMRNIIYNHAGYGMGDYDLGFSEEQYNWLVQDLALVPKSKTVVLCIHIPIRNQRTMGDGTYCQEILKLLNNYAEAHILSGHTHTMYPYNHKYHGTGWDKIYEHTIAATRYDVAGSNLHRDGSPCGYQVLKVEEDGHFSDWYYKGFPHGMNTRDYQMQIYIGGTIVGGEPAAGKTTAESTTGYYKIPYDSKTVLANIFTSDPSWDVKVSLDGGSTWNKMERFTGHKKNEFADLTGSGTKSDPMTVNPDVECSRDMWTIGLLFGVLGSEVNNSYGSCYTMWKYTSTKTINTSKVKVRAIDSHSGYTYECNRVEGSTYPYYVQYDPQYNPTIE